MPVILFHLFKSVDVDSSPAPPFTHTEFHP